MFLVPSVSLKAFRHTTISLPLLTFALRNYLLDLPDRSTDMEIVEGKVDRGLVSVAHVHMGYQWNLPGCLRRRSEDQHTSEHVSTVRLTFKSLRSPPALANLAASAIHDSRRRLVDAMPLL